MDGGGHEDGGVRHTAGDDHVGALFQRLQNSLHTHIGIGGDNLAGELGEGFAGLPHLGVHVLIDDGQQIVAGDAGDLHPRQSVLLGDLHALGRRRLGIGGAHVGDELHLMLPAQGERPLHAVLQQAVIALAGVFQFGLLADGDGALGQTFITDVIQVALFNEFQRGFQAVAGVSGAGADADGFHNDTLPFSRIVWSRIGMAFTELRRR